MSASAPVFAVVGRVNRGKSSIVSTLAADDSVLIEARPGTTRRNRAYPMRIGDRTLYTLVDTPGFERPRQVLAWLREHETSTKDRAELVRLFLKKHEHTDAYPQECELLRPILDGAAILYVVDSSVPFSGAYEAETQILRWTGRPRMALINPIGEGVHTDEWRRVLDQYFSLVRVFDAHAADFEARIEVLRALRELAVEWQPALDEGIRILCRDREQRIRACAEQLADALIDLLTASDELKLSPESDPAAHRDELSQRYQDRLRSREHKLHRELRRSFLHHQLQIRQSELSGGGEDLFDTSTWSRLGLSRMQLAMTGAATGALVGGGIDLATGGASLLAGAAIGGAVGLISTFAAWGSLAQIRVLGSSLGGKLLRIGPIRDPNFAWIVLDRAFLFFGEVANHPHARRDRVELAGRPSVAQNLPAARRSALERIFRGLRRAASDRSLQSELRVELIPLLEACLRELAHFDSRAG